MLNPVGVFKSNQDDSIKSVFKNNKDEIIEISLLQNKPYDVICVPTFHYCNLGCKMCHLTNRQKKTMTPITCDELMEAIYKSIIIDHKKITDKKNLLISLMGVGEPLLNFNLIEALHENEACFKMMGYENVVYSISTMMPLNNVSEVTKRVLQQNIPLKIHYSLHTPNESIRSELIPSSKVSIEDSLKSLAEYRDQIKNNEKIMSTYTKIHNIVDPIEIHYTLINGVNDSPEELEKLIELMNKYKISIKFIKFNELFDMKISDNETMWVDKIKSEVEGVRVKTYTPPGKDIGASCGDFTKHFYLYESETLEEKQEYVAWYQEHIVEEPKKLIKSVK